jgi:DNA-binding MarR family transcriptional regulator
VTKLVGRMAEAGWVQRVDAPHDKRQSLVSLTPAGHRKVKPLLNQARLHEAQVMTDIGADEVTLLKRTLERLIEARC